jgi:prenyltransferase beta subunit
MYLDGWEWWFAFPQATHFFLHGQRHVGRRNPKNKDSPKEGGHCGRESQLKARCVSWWCKTHWRHKKD